MSRIIAFESVTLDGVMQAPGRPDEDTRGGFQHGGWATPYADPDLGKAAGESMGRTGGLLLGRRTYVDFYGYWPHQTDNPFTDVLNRTTKYVASRTLPEPLAWANSIRLAGDETGDVTAAVAVLRERPGQDLVVLGSGELVRSLIHRGLIDEYMLLVHPVILGSGQRLFADDGTHAQLRLVDATTTSSGVVIATYRP
jgi:dihydrofolate reductase